MGFFFKKKICIEDCATAIVCFISDMQRKVHNEFSESLYAKFKGSGDNIDADEYLRRDWEILLYILSLILILIEDNFNQDDGLPIMEGVLSKIIEDCSGKKYQEIIDSDPQDLIDFRNTVLERVNLYKRALLHDGSGTDIKRLSECLLSVIWFEDPHNPLMAGLGLLEGIYITEISLKVVEFLKEFFDGFEIK